MSFRTRRGRAYNPRRNPPVVNNQGVQVPSESPTIEFSEFSEGTERELKRILDGKEAARAEEDAKASSGS